MTRFNTHFKHVSSYDFLLKQDYRNAFQLPTLQRITLNMSSIQLVQEKKKIIPFLLLCELITGQKGKITVSKKNKINLKIKKGMVVGCKVNLNRRQSDLFLEKVITFILPQLKEFQGYPLAGKTPHLLSFTLPTCLAFPELANEYASFATLPPLHLTLQVQGTTGIDTALCLTSLNFPIQA